MNITCEAEGYIYGIHEDGPYRVKDHGQPESDFAILVLGYFAAKKPKGVCYNQADRTVWWFHDDTGLPYHLSKEAWGIPCKFPGEIKDVHLKDGVMIVAGEFICPVRHATGFLFSAMSQIQTVPAS